MSACVFISYRRDDCASVARLLHNELSQRFGAANVFMDIDDIGYGDDFAHVIDDHLESFDVVVVVIGPRWAEIIEERLRGDDWVRHEIKRALARRAAGRARVLPVLVGGVAWPGSKLPGDIAALQRLSALKFDERDLKSSVTRLVEAIRQEGFEDEVVRLKGQRLARLAAALVGIVMFIAAWTALFEWLGLDTRAASATMALAALTRGEPPAEPVGSVVLVSIDSSTEGVLGRGFDVTWRAEHAQLIRRALDASARAVTFDLMLEDDGDAAADAALEQALAAARDKLPVVFGVQRLRGDAPVLLPRFAALARWGIACAGVKLGQARTMPLAVQRASSDAAEPPAVLPTLALAAVSGGGAIEPLDESVQRVQVVLQRDKRSTAIAYFSAETVKAPKPGCEAIRTGDRVATQLFDPFTLPALNAPPHRVAYEKVIAGDPQAMAALAGRIVLVGLQLPEQDLFAVAAGAAGRSQRWGVELIAAQIDAIDRGTTIRSLGAMGQALLALLAALGGAAITIALRRQPRWWRALAVTAAVIGFTVACVAWYRIEQQLLGVQYGIGALVLGAWAAARITKKAER